MCTITLHSINLLIHSNFLDELENFKKTQSIRKGDPKGNKINIQVTGSLPIVKWYKVIGSEKRLLVSYEDDLKKQILGKIKQKATYINI